MAKTIRDTILAYPGLADCEDFLDNVVLPGRGFEGTAFYHISPFLV